VPRYQKQSFYFFAFLGGLDGGPPTVPYLPLRVPSVLRRTPWVVPTAFCGGFFGFAITNFLTSSPAKMQLTVTRIKVVFNVVGTNTGETEERD
jgi:hypothetical protein